MQHSNIVGGSTAKRVINCPGSVALVQKMPPQPSSKYADEGTLLHDTIADVLHHLKTPEDYLGRTHNEQVLTQELIDDKLMVALKLLDEVDPNQEMVYEVEQRVGFGDILPGVFGSTDLIGRIGSRAIVLDWKFGDGVAVDATENPQLMFYAAAAMRTEGSKWAFEGADEIECIIIQPPVIRRWVTTPKRIAEFEQQLVAAVKTALKLLDEVDPNQEMVYEVEQRVGFGDILPGVFGSTDLIGRIGSRAIVLDWKFGDGVAVDAVENPQLMFYAAAAMRTEGSKWAFEGATEIECIIIQPPSIRRWVTTPKRIAEFEQQLVAAVKTAMKPDAPLMHGDHCRWCAAKPICPRMTGAVDRALKVQLESIDAATLGKYLQNAELLEEWIKDLRALAHRMLEKNVPVPGYKLVAKQSRRKWTDEQAARKALLDMGLKESVVVETSIMSPAQAEKALKKRFSELPEGLIKSESSGTTLAPESDDRPAVLTIGATLVGALSKLV